MAINGTVNADKRLAVTADRSLFNHEGNGHQITVNKSKPSDTASFLFQSNFSGRAEIGTTGDENLHIKVSPSDSNWMQALTVDSQTGAVKMPNSLELSQLPLWNWLGDGGRMMGSPEPQGLAGNQFIQPNYFSFYNQSIFSEGPKVINNNSNFGGSAGQMSDDLAQLIEKLRPQTAAYYLRFGPEFFTLKIQAGAGTASGIIHNGQAFYPYLVNKANPIPQKVSLNFWVKVLSDEALCNQTTNNQLYMNGTKAIGHRIIDEYQGWRQITCLVTVDPTKMLEYSTSLCGLYAKSESIILIALPSLFPFHITTNRLYGAQMYGPTAVCKREYWMDIGSR